MVTTRIEISAGGRHVTVEANEGLGITVGKALELWRDVVAAGPGPDSQHGGTTSGSYETAGGVGFMPAEIQVPERIASPPAIPSPDTRRTPL